MLVCTNIAASSRSFFGSAARTRATCAADIIGGWAEDPSNGRSNRTMMSFIVGNADVAMASMSGSVGQRASEDGENATHFF